MTATLSEAAGEPVTVTVFAEAVSPAEAGDFELSANTALTIPAGQTSSTGLVTVAAVNDETHAPDRTVTVTGTVTAGPEGLAAPAAQTLEITEDEDTPVVTLKLDPASISENEGETTVTASLSGPSSENLTVTVTARPESPAVDGDFELTGTTLTIEAGDTESTGEVKVTAEDNDLDAPEKRVVIGGTVTGGNGAAAPAPLTLRITDDEDTPTLTLALDPDVDLGERRREHGDGVAGRAVERRRDRDGIRDRGGAGGRERFPPERESGADDPGGAFGEHGGGDDLGREQRGRRAGQDGRGDGVGQGRERRGGASGAEADDHRRR